MNVDKVLTRWNYNRKSFYDKSRHICPRFFSFYGVLEQASYSSPVRLTLCSVDLWSFSSSVTESRRKFKFDEMFPVAHLISESVLLLDHKSKDSGPGASILSTDGVNPPWTVL